jgi:hypothetical protein
MITALSASWPVVEVAAVVGLDGQLRLKRCSFTSGENRVQGRYGSAHGLRGDPAAGPEDV